MYENYPFWFTLLTSLGFKVMISGRSSHELFETGIESIASENICYPAKLVHGHIKWLLDKGVKTIFYPCVSYEENLVPNTDNHYNCPVVANYPLVVGANMPELREDGVRYMHPYFNLANHELMVDRILEEFAWANVTREEVETAVKAAYAEDKVFKHDVQQEGPDRARLHEGAQLPRHRARRPPLPHRPRNQPRHPRNHLLAGHGGALRGFHLRTAAGEKLNSPNSSRKAKPTRAPRTPPDSAT